MRAADVEVETTRDRTQVNVGEADLAVGAVGSPLSRGVHLAQQPRHGLEGLLASLQEAEEYVVTQLHRANHQPAREVAAPAEEGRRGGGEPAEQGHCREGKRPRLEAGEHGLRVEVHLEPAAGPDRHGRRAAAAVDRATLR